MSKEVGINQKRGLLLSQTKTYVEKDGVHFCYFPCFFPPGIFNDGL